MITLAIIALISFFALAFTSALCSTSRNKLVSFICSCVSLAILLVSMSSAFFSAEFTANSAKPVAKIVNQNEGKHVWNEDLYYNTETEQYFEIYCNLWNPFRSTYRHYIDSERAKEYVEVYNELAEIKLN